MSAHSAQVTTDRVDRSWMLLPLCLGVLMTSASATSANVALSSIALDLHFSKASLVWVVTAYTTTFGGFMLLGGRLGDLFGGRRAFLLGVVLFTLAALVCGLAPSAGQLVAARAVQGLGAAIVSAVGLSQIMHLFSDGPKRARALGAYVFVNAGGSAMGLLLGGILTSALSWQWIFLVHVPLGACVCCLCAALWPRGVSVPRHLSADVAGAVTGTLSLMCAMYAIVNAGHVGWMSVETLCLLGVLTGLLLLFVRVESRAHSPLVPRRLFRDRSFATANVSSALLAAAMFGWSFVTSLYLQLVLQLDPLQVGLTFLPANLTIAAMSLLATPALVRRFGIRRPLFTGMLIAGVGLALLARTPASASMAFDVLPGMMLVGLGAGMAYNPMLLGALSRVAPCDAGAASGLVNTSFTLGGALGLSGLASVAATRTDHLLTAGVELSLALSGGYRLAYGLAAVLAILGGTCGIVMQEPRAALNSQGNL